MVRVTALRSLKTYIKCSDHGDFCVSRKVALHHAGSRKYLNARLNIPANVGVSFGDKHMLTYEFLTVG